MRAARSPAACADLALRISRAFTGVCSVSDKANRSQLSVSSLLNTGANIRPSLAGSRETRRIALLSFNDCNVSRSGPAIFRSGSIPRRTRARAATSCSPPIASVVGPTRARANSGRNHIGNPEIVRRSKALSRSTEFTTRETSVRASTSTYSRVAGSSPEARARVTRTASRDRVRTGVRCALAIRPAQTFCQSAG